MQNYLSQIDMLSEKLAEVQQEKNQLVKQNKCLLNLSVFNDSTTQIFKCIDVNDRPMVVTITEEIDWMRQGRVNEVRFELFDLYDSRIPNYHCSELWVRMNYFENATYLKSISIIDCRTHREHMNKGYGSQLMLAFLDYAMLLDRKELEITGFLSTVDERNKENHKRRNHFYQKFGFSIDGKRISLKLKKN